MLNALVINVVRLTIWLVLLAVIFVPLERLFALHPRSLWRRGLWVDLSLYFLNSLLPAFILSIPLAALATIMHRVLPSAFVDSVATLPFGVRLFAAFVVGEIGFYWGHRWTHEIPLLWRFHSVHHEPEHIDWLVNTRAHPVDMVFTRLCGMVPLYIIGLGGPGSGMSITGQDSVVPALVVIISTIWGFFIHANVGWRFGPFEWLLSTPAFHHWHHVVAGPINRNYASMLPVLDRVFGTHHLPRREWPGAYGIVASAPNPSASRSTSEVANPAFPAQ